MRKHALSPGARLLPRLERMKQGDVPHVRRELLAVEIGDGRTDLAEDLARRQRLTISGALREGVACAVLDARRNRACN